ncbi:putative D-aminoacylase [Pseudovirgaria hyperparasitica]|uniref:Putative D-aminoacylase n=1 Tax=Pseudovirgaria hyperparasitica TaxID=470096 RepID=A0A6A6VUW4_9PEZI|nr:putative D-aminoacylase [Pseudovirgaria hyperparasitica]KAF2753576.1 putative D-aminoacylase [Pseudovirgaria hyperparasitica]
MSSSLVNRFRDLESEIKELCKICGTPGVSVGISLRGENIYLFNSGFLDIEKQLPTHSDGIYALGTLAKTFTASAIGLLVAEGKVKWDSHIKDVLPNFRSKDAIVTENVTIEDLLCHRSGLSRSNLWWLGSDGQLLLPKDKLLDAYRNLELTGSFRGSWGYSNWGYAIVGEVIEKLTGMTYGQFITTRIIEPLGLRHTTAQPVDVAGDNLARPYAALDNADLYPLPQTPISERTIMAPAMGLHSSPHDLLTYSIALLRSLRSEQGQATNSSPSVLREVTAQLSGHAFVSRSVNEKSYAFGFYRTALPSTIAGMGCNGFHVKTLPRIVPGVQCGPLIAHAGSVPGYSNSLALLPELDASVVVCTNSIGLGDASGWIAMALIEALIESPVPTDFVAYAKEAAKNHAESIRVARSKLEKVRAPDTKPKPLEVYVGSYLNEEHDWVIVVRQRQAGGLEVLFQGLESQAWLLTHYEHDTFLWMADRNEQAKRGRVTTYVQADSFKLIFGGAHGKIDRLYWPQEAGLALDKQCFLRM